ncbi:MAG: MFS transporter, partial [Bryobacterales bacterium]|nr:MFS transporter [Bryobacterales bacterium]
MWGFVTPPSSPATYLVLVCGTGAFGGFLFGFDTAVISGTVGPLERQFRLGAALLGWTVSSALLGSVFGAAASGTLSDRYGRKISLILAGVLFLVSAVGSALAPALWALIAARLVGGVGV